MIQVLEKLSPVSWGCMGVGLRRWRGGWVGGWVGVVMGLICLVRFQLAMVERARLLPHLRIPSVFLHP